MDLDWEQEERARRARREAEERRREANNDAGKKKKRDILKDINGGNAGIFPRLTPKEQQQSAVCGLVGRLCGGGTSQTHDQDQAGEAEKLTDITENHLWKKMVDANALIMMAVAVFLWGYFA